MSIDYLVSRPEFIQNYGTLPFDNQIVNFLNDLSIEIKKIKNIKDFPDLTTLAFFLRKKNIISLKNKFYVSKEKRIGLGLLFHITPANIPINFAYSLFFGLINGNSNLIKVTSKKYIQTDVICFAINKLIKKHKFIKKKICIVKYDNQNEFTSKFSNMCDARLIWGGNKTINEVRKFSVSERSHDLLFADRYSFCIIDQLSLSKISDKNFDILVKKFYTDTYHVDQNGCSSPHLIIWYGKNNDKIKKTFWSKLLKEIKKNYVLSNKSSFDKLDFLCDVILNKKIDKISQSESPLYVVQLKKLFKDIDKFKGKWGFFFEYNCNDLKDINTIVNKNYQTLTYFGFKKEKLIEHIIKYKLKGIDRVVPIGNSLDMNLIWDGYDLTKNLTRVISSI